MQENVIRKERVKVVEYDASVKFEISVDLNGSNFLVIYGRHINGYYIAIPSARIACEAAEPSDTFYNCEKLIGAGLKKIDAAGIATVIRDYDSLKSRK